VQVSTSVLRMPPGSRARRVRGGPRLAALLLPLLAWGCRSPAAPDEPAAVAATPDPAAASAAPQPAPEPEPPKPVDSLHGDGTPLPSPLGGGAADHACTRDADCGEGEACIGPGCDGVVEGGQCRSTTMCTRDLQTYCGCDGTTFRGSGSCPGRPFRARAACEGDAAP